jgi:hypothetical protein
MSKNADAQRRSSILWALERAEPRVPDTDDQNSKRKYAQRFSDALAILVANTIRKRHRGFKTIKPDASGKGKESPAKTKKGFKKLDVNYSTPELGLSLGISIKTVNHKDLKTGRYDHNYSRHDTEFLAESSAYHQRQPYAVLAALFFLPVDGCSDATGKRASSFGRAVEWFYHRAGRNEPSDDPNLFERVLVAFYDASDGPSRGDVFFFDVMTPPPRNGPPKDGFLMTFEEAIDSIVETYESRNGLTFRWASEEPATNVPEPADRGTSDEDEE